MSLFRTVVSSIRFGFLWLSLRCSHALKSPPTKSLKASLQRCYRPKDVVQLIANELTADKDPYGTIASLCLVRLSKQLVALDNQSRHDGQTEAWIAEWMTQSKAFSTVSEVMGQAIYSKNCDKAPEAVESLVEGIKSMSVLSRLLPYVKQMWDPTLERLDHQAEMLSLALQPHHVSGLHWAYDCFNLETYCYSLPSAIQESHDNLGLPFRIRPGHLAGIPNFSVQNLVSQVNFQVDAIRTTATNQVVPERRQTAWEGDDGVAPFAYSGKSMETNRWSPLVQIARDSLAESTGSYYDGCLLNLYPDGGSGMRYHIDPDQGVLWNYETAVVSVGSTRRFSFRRIPSLDDDQQQQQHPHTFVLMHGDVTEMFGDCQSRFQHTVRTADAKDDDSPRASLVFKRTLSK